MSFILENKEFVLALFVPLSSLLIWVSKRVIDTIVSKRIYNFLIESKKEGYRFRSTHAIAAHIDIPEDKVSKLCAKSSKIKRNNKKRESWRAL